MAVRFSLRDVLTIVFKRRVLIVLFASSVFFAVMTVSFMLPRTYEVSAILLVNKARAEVPIAPTDSSQLIVGVSEQDLNTEIEVLNDRRLVQEVVTDLGIEESERPKPGRMDQLLGRIREFLGSPHLSYVDSLVVGLQEELQISTVRRSNAIRISYVSEDPLWATQVVASLTEKYLERRVEAFQSPQAVAFFEEQMREAKQQLNHYESSIEAFVEAMSLTIVKGPQQEDALAAQKAMAMARLSDVESALGDGEVEMQEMSREGETLRARLSEEPERIPTASRYSVTASTEEIEIALTEMRLRRDELLQDFRPDSRHVRDIDSQIWMAEARLKKINDEGAGLSGTERNPVFDQLKSDLLRTETELDGIRARIVSLRTQAAQNRKILDELSTKSFELAGLRRNATAAEEDFLLYRKKHEEARISAAMDKEKFVNVTVAQPAQHPLEPMPRGLVTKFFLGLILGIFGAFGVAFGLEFYLDRSFTTGEEIERKLGIPHIASIPDGEAVGF